ncbi:hypothetical protein CSUI_005530, partial [Cystoisospora suis]
VAPDSSFSGQRPQIFTVFLCTESDGNFQNKGIVYANSNRSRFLCRVPTVLCDRSRSLNVLPAEFYGLSSFLLTECLHFRTLSKKETRKSFRIDCFLPLSFGSPIFWDFQLSPSCVCGVSFDVQRYKVSECLEVR